VIRGSDRAELGFSGLARPGGRAADRRAETKSGRGTTKCGTALWLRTVSKERQVREIKTFGWWRLWWWCG